jgi:uncharacterized Tic20 family protein
METSASGALFPTSDERIMAALAHLSAILPMWGILAPIVIWLTQREKSRWAAFQALQAIAFQIVVILVYIIGFACYMGSFFALMIGGVLGSQMGSFEPAFGVSFALPFLVLFLLLGVTLLSISYGIVAAVSTFQGKNFRYAIIGRRLEDYLRRADVHQAR